MKFEIGPKIRPSALLRESDDTNLYGEGWHARRDKDGRMLSWDGGGLGSKPVVVSIADAEFEALRSDPSSFRALQIEHADGASDRGEAHER